MYEWAKNGLTNMPQPSRKPALLAMPPPRARPLPVASSAAPLETVAKRSRSESRRFLAERYERRSVIITSNVVFSEWDRIFKDPMTTAIDRLVHHSVILEMTGTSVRADAAEQAKKEAATTVTGKTTKNRQSVNKIDGEV